MSSSRLPAWADIFPISPYMPFSRAVAGAPRAEARPIPTTKSRRPMFMDPKIGARGANGNAAGRRNWAVRLDAGGRLALPGGHAPRGWPGADDLRRRGPGRTLAAGRCGDGVA